MKSQMPRHKANPQNTNRHRREINFDIDFNVNTALKTVVYGVVSIFSSPQSLDKIQKSVDKVAFRTSRLESKFANFTTRVDNIIHWIKVDFSKDVNEIHMISSINSTLDLANEGIMELLKSVIPLVQGKLAYNLLDPLQYQSLIDTTQSLADTYGLQVIFDQPVDIWKYSVTTFATNSTCIQWSFTNGIVALQPELLPDIKIVFVPMESLDKVCERFNNRFLCHKRINHFLTCQVSLLSNHTLYCSLKIAAPKVRYSFESFNFLFSRNQQNL